MRIFFFFFCFFLCFIYQFLSFAEKFCHLLHLKIFAMYFWICYFALIFSQRYIKYTLVHSSKLLAYLFYVFLFRRSFKTSMFSRFLLFVCVYVYMYIHIIHAYISLQLSWRQYAFHCQCKTLFIIMIYIDTIMTKCSSSSEL